MSDPGKALLERSGHVDSDDPLVSVLYSLLRDHAQPGVLEALVIDIERSKETCGVGTVTRYSNSWLASYAKDLAGRIRTCERRR